MPMTWVYMGGDGMTEHRNEDWPEATRREWWYEPGNTYVYQTREPGGDWGEVFNEYEADGYPEWVREALDQM